MYVHSISIQDSWIKCQELIQSYYIRMPTCIEEIELCNDGKILIPHFRLILANCAAQQPHWLNVFSGSRAALVNTKKSESYTNLNLISSLKTIQLRGLNKNEAEFVIIHFGKRSRSRLWSLRNQDFGSHWRRLWKAFTQRTSTTIS